MAADEGETLTEIVVNIVVVGIIIASMVMLVVLTSNLFGSTSGGAGISESVRPDRVVRRELSRTSDRILVVDQCLNPSGETSRPQCLETKDMPFPRPQKVPTWYTDATVRHNDPPTINDPLCWMVERDPQHEQPTGSSNSDTRNLECWYHVPVIGANNNIIGGDMRVGIHQPKTTSPTQDTSDLFKPEWNVTPYHTSTITDRVVSVNGWQCMTEDRQATPTWNQGLCSSIVISSSDTIGVLALTVELCVALPTTGGQNSSGNALLSNAGCNPVDVTVSPGRN